ncbi:RidA family protein [Paenibacillus alkalitolerans]|uniref:RidA family protein n=1 Tax=Paenibacillus alkalitolerans TaxID=2799335 RepID=UPI0018F43420|nr:RidA family protein [Paenibacillus alkalitolerans]
MEATKNLNRTGIKKLAAVTAVIGLSVMIGWSAVSALPDTPNKYPDEPIHESEFYGSPTSAISSGVSVPAGSSYLFTSGTVPPLLNKDGKTIYERYGDTKTQGIGVLTEIKKQLNAKGLSMEDVIYLRVYLVADAAKEGKIDYQGWFDAYGQFFNTEDNPVKPARSTVGVAGLVNSDWLIEIEAVAVYPKKK